MKIILQEKNLQGLIKDANADLDAKFKEEVAKLSQETDIKKENILNETSAKIEEYIDKYNDQNIIIDQNFESEKLKKQQEFEALLQSQKDDYINIARADYFNATYLIRKGKMDSAGMLVNRHLAYKAITKDIGLFYKFRFSKTSILVRNNKLKEALEN